MKKFFKLIFKSLLRFDSRQPKQNAKSNEQYGEELIANGFLEFSDSEHIAELQKEILESFNIYEERLYRFAHIDAEELAEFSFHFFLPALNKVLEKRKVQITAKAADDYEQTNDAIINGDRINLYTKNELEHYRLGDSASRNFFRKINDILKSKDLYERFYLLNGANDLSTLLLTDKQFEIIKNYFNNDQNDTPYLP